MALFSKKGPEFEIEHRGMGRSSTCFPVGYDKSDLMEIMDNSSGWAVFYNPRTGETINCSDFYKQLAEKLERNDGM
jgi:hypothetical protein